jgi:hypothetical protein
LGEEEEEEEEEGRNVMMRIFDHPHSGHWSLNVLFI